MMKGCCKYILFSFIGFAMIMGTLANLISFDSSGNLQRIVASVVLFFDVMIPILGVASLLKFLLTSNSKNGETTCCSCSESQNTDCCCRNEEPKLP